MLIVALCLVWAVFEVGTGEPFWAMLFGAIGLYAGYGILLQLQPREPDDK